MPEISTQSVSVERMPSGIAGFDQLLQGGFFKGETYLLMGPPGAGKTIFGNQICFNHVANGGHAIYMTLLAETHSRMLTHMQSFEFYTAEPLANQLSYISGSSTLEQKGLDALLTLIRKEVRKQHATLLVIDGIITIEQNAASLRERKDFLHALSMISESVGCIILLLMQFDRNTYDQPEHTMVDGLFQLSARLNDMRSTHEIQIRKFRGSKFLEGRHLYAITDKGFIVHPRTEEVLRPLALPLTSTPMSAAVAVAETKLGFGLERLDEMVHGGMSIGSSTMVLGSPGTGKTLLGLHFLYQGVREGQQGLYFGFSETPAQLKQRMKYLLRSPLQNPQTSPPPGGSTNHNVKSPKKSGASTEEQDTEDMDTDNLLEMLWQPPTEDIIDVLAERLIETVRQRGVRRLFIDGLAGFQNTTASPERLNGLFSTILTTLRTMDVTTIWAVELADLFTTDIVMPELVSKMAAQVENIMLLRHVELYSQLYRLISIMKMRQSGYDPSIREFRITDYGLDVASTFTSAESILTGIAHPREAPQVSSFGISGLSVQEEQQ
jgi:circadian clock protein KaiC